MHVTYFHELATYILAHFMFHPAVQNDESVLILNHALAGHSVREEQRIELVMLCES